MKSQSAQFLLDGMLVDAQLINGVLWIKTDEGVQTLEVKNRFVTHNQNERDGKSILAPMPGKIIKIAASVGQAIETHDTVIVMEAMKMEYQLKASKPGVVDKIHCRVGDQVALGQLLSEIVLK